MAKISENNYEFGFMNQDFDNNFNPITDVNLDQFNNDTLESNLNEHYANG